MVSSGQATALTSLPATLRSSIAIVVLLILAAAVTFPSAWAVINSLKTSAELANNPLGLPSTPTFSNYAEAWVQARFGTYMLNSFIIAIPTVICVVIISTLGGYAFAHFEFVGKNVLYLYVVAGLAIPFVVIIIPLYFQMRAFGLLNTHVSVILPQIAAILPFGTVLTRNFMLEIPRSLLDAGTIDGCNSFQLLTNIVVPSIWPALTSLMVFSFMWTWNQLFLPMVMLTDSTLRPLPVGLTYFQGQYGTNIPVLAAAAIMASLPVVIMYLLLQRQFVHGLTAGGVKG